MDGSKMTKQTRYESGRAAEGLVRKIFQKEGWIVTRSAASKGPFDIIATKITPKNRYTIYYLVLMQVKKKKVG